MQKTPADTGCVFQFRPDFHHVVYKTSVDVTGRHISGLLLIKQMPDSSMRVAFSNEMGFSFFDFGFLAGDSFRVYQIIPKMNNKALIRTLRKDFELILFKNMNQAKAYTLTDQGVLFHAYPQTKGVNYYITDSLCRRLIKMQRASNKKPVVEAIFSESIPGTVPDSISIRHLNFGFSISLKKIPALAPE